MPGVSTAVGCDDFHQLVETCVLADPGGRGVRRLAVAGQMQSGAHSLLHARRVVIATGFFIPEANACETDGPPGALELAEGLRTLGADVSFLTDSACAPVLQRAGLEPLGVDDPEVSVTSDATHLIAIERLGRAIDGRYYNMRGQDVTACTGDVDRHFLAATSQGIVTIGIGDGGNEIGMGNVRERVVAHIPHGAAIASIVPVDFLIVAGTSNWGAWGLLAELSQMTGQGLVPTVDQSRSTLERFAAAGAVDAISKRPIPIVDGLDELDYFRPLEVLHRRLAGS